MFKMIKVLPALFLMLVAPSHQQALPTSPCPNVLIIDKPEGTSADRWFGTITLPGKRPTWVFLNIVLDRKADLLGNYLDEVSTKDNIDFKIDNTMMHTKPAPIRFFVKYDPQDEKTPSVKIIRLNGKDICNKDNPVEEEASVAPPVPLSHSGASFNIPTKPSLINRVQQRPSFIIRPDQIISSQNQCGIVKLQSINSLVVKGTPTREGQWPWQVALYQTQGVNHQYTCGGTLITRKHVITAAHCTTDRNSNPFQLLNSNSLTVYLGKHNLVTSVTGVQIRFISKIKVYPDYTPGIFARDLSILVLRKPVDYTDWVQPACMWPEELEHPSNIIGRSGSVVGWGNDGSGVLTLVEMPVVDQETCLRSNGELFLRLTSNFTYCAGSRDGSSVCNGDSGGGMVFNIGGAWYLRGVVSVSALKDGEDVCDPEQYAVFTDVAKYLPWIRENLKEH